MASHENAFPDTGSPGMRTLDPCCRPHYDLSTAASPRKRGPPPRLLSAIPVASAQVTLTDIQSMSAGARADVTVAIESVLPSKTVTGPKFDGEFSKAVLIDSTCTFVCLI